jgi:hypothetical protein
MSHCMPSILGLAAGGLILVAASAQPAVPSTAHPFGPACLRPRFGRTPSP